MPNDGAPAQALYDSVKATSAKRLVNGVERVDGLSPEEEQALERGGALALRGTKRRVLRWAWYTGFGCVSLLALAACVALIAIVAIYIYTIAENGTLGGVIGSIIEFTFGAFSVLAVELLVKKASGKA